MANAGCRLWLYGRITLQRCTAQSVMLCGPYATVKTAEFRHWRVAETLRPGCTESKNTFQRNKRTFTFTNTSLQQFPSLNVRTSTRENLVCTPTTGCVIRLRSCFLRVCTQLHAKCEAGKKKKNVRSPLFFYSLVI